MNIENLTWEDALQRLKSGNQRFINEKNEHQNEGAARRGELTGGQKPYAIILGCADSRVVPELVFDTGLGELFTIRVAGNVANASTLASIEYAVAHLGTNLIIVLGHESCGAVQAALAGGDLGYNLNHLLSHLQPAVESCDDSSTNAVVRENARLTAEAIVERSPLIQDEKSRRELKILPAFYHLKSGEVEFLG
ncbi:MAG: carbonic anhydrase [Calditrichia bacterium]